MVFTVSMPAGELGAADHRGIRRAFAVFAVARGTLLRVDGCALRGRAASGRQAGAVGQDADVPGRDLCGIDGLAEIGPCRQTAEN